MLSKHCLNEHQAMPVFGEGMSIAKNFEQILLSLGGQCYKSEFLPKTEQLLNG